MSVECERGSRRGDSRYLSTPSPPEPSSPLSLGTDNRYPLGVHHLLTSLGKELRVYLFEVLLVDDAAGAFLHRDNQTQQTHTLPPLGQRLPEGRQIILPLWNLPELW